MDRTRRPRQDCAERAGRAGWAAHVARRPLDPAAPLVTGSLADRATGEGRLRVAADLAACCCLPPRRVADARADLASRGLLACDGPVLVFTVPAAGGWSR